MNNIFDVSPKNHQNSHGSDVKKNQRVFQANYHANHQANIFGICISDRHITGKYIIFFEAVKSNPQIAERHTSIFKSSFSRRYQLLFWQSSIGLYRIDILLILMEICADPAFIQMPSENI